MTELRISTSPRGRRLAGLPQLLLALALLLVVFAAPVAMAQDEPAEPAGATAPTAESAPSVEGEGEEEEEEILRPPDKPVEEMTPEERRLFRKWRQQQLEKRGLKRPELEPPPGSVTFELSFPDEKGGGSAAGFAGSITYEREDLAVLSDGVRVRYRDIDIQADRIEVDLEAKTVNAIGNVILDQGSRRLAGSTLDFDLEAKTGSLRDASAYVDPDFYFTGKEVYKTGDNTFRVVEGIFTSCDDEVPDWSFTVAKADIEVDGYARVRSASMKVKKAPVFYLPYLLWPVKEDRTSGFLVPNLGYSRRRGAYLGLAYYKVLGDSYDATFHADLYSEEFTGFGTEFRYRPSEGTKGRVLGYTIRDPEMDEWRWKAELDHQTTDLPFDMRGVVTLREFSDFEFFRDFERNFDRNTVRSIESRGFVSGNWGSHSLNILVNKRETFLNNNTVTLQRLPEIEYRLRPTQLGELPLFLEVESSLSYLSLDRTARLEGEYGRADLFPRLSLPVRVAPWLSVSFTAGGRVTWYGDSLGMNDQGVVQELSGDSLTRTFPVASAEVIGPSFSRIFDVGTKGFSKFKHVVEPRLTYNFLDDFDDRSRIALFDEIDTLLPGNTVRVALVNRLLAKERPDEEDEDEAAGSAREIFSWEVFQLYSLDDEKPLQTLSTGEERTSGPLSTLVRFNPSTDTSLTARLDYNTLASRLTSSSLSGSLGIGASTLGLSWRTRWSAETGDRLSDQARLALGLELMPKRLRLQGDVVYDIENSELQQQRYVLDYKSQCYSLRLEMRDIRIGVEEDRDYRLSLTLKNVGTFLDLTI